VVVRETEKGRMAEPEPPEALETRLKSLAQFMSTSELLGSIVIQLQNSVRLPNSTGVVPGPASSGTYRRSEFVVPGS